VPSQQQNFIIKLKQAYEEFALSLLKKLQEETNITELYYHLGFVRLELVGIRDNLSDGQEKNALKNKRVDLYCNFWNWSCLSVWRSNIL